MNKREELMEVRKQMLAQMEQKLHECAVLGDESELEGENQTGEVLAFASTVSGRDA